MASYNEISVTTLARLVGTPDCPILLDVLRKISEGKGQPGLEGVSWVADGGISSENIQQVVEAGADQLVIGRGIYKNGKIKQNMEEIRQLITSISQ